MSLLPRLLRNRARPLAAMLVMTAAALAALRFAPHGLPRLPVEIEPGVVLLFTPLCVLMLAIMLEALLLIGRDVLPSDTEPAARPLPHWRNDRD